MNELQRALGFYSGKRVLVTGHTGFKGAWLVLWLRNAGADVLGVSLDPPGAPSMHAALALDEIIAGRRVDVADYPELAGVVSGFQPETVFHLAAQSLVRPSYQDPLHTFNANVMGTACLLEACRGTPSVRSIVIVTSDKCYRNNEWLWGYRETDPMGGHDPYSASKGCAELVTAAYRQSYFPASEYGRTHTVAVASARAGNVIGGGDWAVDRLLPDCFRALQEGRSIRLRYPDAVRPWQHVLESLSGYLMLGARLLEHGPVYASGWNFAPLDRDEVWPVARVVDYVCALWGGGSYEVEASGQPHEAGMLCLDASKACAELGWRSRYTVAQALEATIRWYREWARNPDPKHMREYTLRQIQEYAATAPF